MEKAGNEEDSVAGWQGLVEQKIRTGLERLKGLITLENQYVYLALEHSDVPLPTRSALAKRIGKLKGVSSTHTHRL
jgi:hypothetical protein